MGSEPPSASLTSSSNIPVLSSTTITERAFFAVSLSSRDGNGHSVIGRNSPAFTPCARNWSTVERSTRETMPKPISRMSASSVR